jgi:hypothetical protein
MNTKPGRHDVYDRVRRRFQGGGGGGGKDERRLLKAAAAHVRFVDNPGTYGDPTPNKPDPDDLHNPGNVPGHAVRQQTADLATLIDLAVSETSDEPSGSAPYFMFMEVGLFTPGCQIAYMNNTGCHQLNLVFTAK